MTFPARSRSTAPISAAISAPPTSKRTGLTVALPAPDRQAPRRCRHSPAQGPHPAVRRPRAKPMASISPTSVVARLAPSSMPTKPAIGMCCTSGSHPRINHSEAYSAAMASAPIRSRAISAAFAAWSAASTTTFRPATCQPMPTMRHGWRITAGSTTARWPAGLSASGWLPRPAALGRLLAARRIQSLQSRATLLLELHKRWEDLSEDRKNCNIMFDSIRRQVDQEHGHLRLDKYRDKLKFHYHMFLIEESRKNSTVYKSFMSYLGFFEALGVYVRNGYIPVRDVSLLYKVPILDAEIAALKFIERLQKNHHWGLLENGLILIHRVRLRSERPIYYRTTYQIVRFTIEPAVREVDPLVGTAFVGFLIGFSAAPFS
jgi:hypothetical protein